MPLFELQYGSSYHESTLVTAADDKIIAMANFVQYIKDTYSEEDHDKLIIQLFSNRIECHTKNVVEINQGQ